MQSATTRIRHLSHAVAALSPRETQKLFEAWWRRWSPLWSTIYSNVRQLSASTAALRLLDGVWEPLEGDAERSVKSAIRELAKFDRTNVDEAPSDWTLVSDIALASAEIFEALFSARRSCDYVRAMAVVVEWLERVFSTTAWATYRAVLLIDVDDSLRDSAYCEQAEVTWFATAIRAVLLREEIGEVAPESVVLAPAVAALLSVAPDALSR